MKGQAFSVFKILLGAIFATLLLIMIYAILAGIVFPLNPAESIKNIALQASRAPGTCVAMSELQLKKGWYLESSAETFKPIIIRCLYSRHPEACPACSTSCCSRCEIKMDIKIPVSSMCDDSGCAIFFGCNNCK